MSEFVTTILGNLQLSMAPSTILHALLRLRDVKYSVARVTAVRPSLAMPRKTSTNLLRTPPSLTTELNKKVLLIKDTSLMIPETPWLLKQENFTVSLPRDTELVVKEELLISAPV